MKGVWQPVALVLRVPRVLRVRQVLALVQQVLALVLALVRQVLALVRQVLALVLALVRQVLALVLRVLWPQLWVVQKDLVQPARRLVVIIAHPLVH
jgi:phage-related protein